MKTLGLSVVDKEHGGKEVAAREVVNGCGEVTGSTGDIEVDGKEEVIWRNCGEGWQGTGTYTFLVTFERKASTEKWPFHDPKKPADTTLVVPPQADVSTTVKNAFSKQYWKYEAAVQHNGSIETLDPMIIIRGRSSAELAVLAVGAAILIAAAVYLLRRSLSRRTTRT
jgi:hypothetical protein